VWELRRRKGQTGRTVESADETRRSPRSTFSDSASCGRRASERFGLWDRPPREGPSRATARTLAGISVPRTRRQSWRDWARGAAPSHVRRTLRRVLRNFAAEPGRVRDPSETTAERGRRGEDLAREHFESLGFETVAHNQRTSAGEIDLVVFDGRNLVFVEVKTGRVRRDGCGAFEWDSLAWPRPTQRSRIRLAAQAWLSAERENRPWAQEIRIDLLKVLFDEAGEHCRTVHIAGIE
jgi:putative endonuclease